MITFEEAIKELKISQEALKGASFNSSAQIVSISREVNDVVDFLSKHRECDVAIHGYSIDITFCDSSVKSFYPLVVKAIVQIWVRTLELCEKLWKVLSTSPAPSDTEKEFASRLGQLSSWLDADEMTTSKQYTEFGQGARAALEVMAVYSNTPEESAKYLDEIKAKSFVSIRREVNTDPDCCPLCGSRVINSTNEDWDKDKYYDDIECGDCGAKWTLNYKYIFKSCIADKDGTTIIPTNQEVKNESIG